MNTLNILVLAVPRGSALSQLAAQIYANLHHNLPTSPLSRLRSQLFNYRNGKNGCHLKLWSSVLLCGLLVMGSAGLGKRSPLASFSSTAELHIYPPDWPNRTGGVEQFSVCDCHVGSDLLVACGPSSDTGSAKLLWRCTAGENGKIQIEIMNNIMHQKETE